MSLVPFKIGVVVPIAVSIASLLFGVFQYFDKRGLERDLNEQQLKMNSADLEVYYLETDLESILITSNFDDLTSATLQWMEEVERYLEIQNVQLQETPVLLEIADAIYGNEDLNDAQDPQLSFLFIRNMGRANASNASLAYETRDTEYRSLGRSTLVIGVIEANHAVIVPIGAYEAHTERILSSEIKPSRLEYTDESTGKAVAFEVRERYQSPRYVAPKIKILE